MSQKRSPNDSSTQVEKKKRRVVLSIPEKLKILKRLEENEDGSKEAGAAVAKEYGLSKSVISKWKKQKNELENFASQLESTEGNMSKKTMKVPVNNNVEQGLYIWFKQMRGLGWPVTGTLLQEKVTVLNEKFGGNGDFKASNGWLYKFQNRHGLRKLDMVGEKLSSDKDAAQIFVQELQKITQDPRYVRGNIWNCDESGLYWKALPDKTLASKREASCPGPKMQKDRMTILFCSNSDGSCRLRLMAIGKSKKPRCFKNLKGELPVLYRNNSTAWMRSGLFESWFFEEWVPAAKEHNLKNGLPDFGLLLMDNASVHLPDDGVLTTKDRKYKALFLPPNVTALIQPLDQCIIETFKRYYRKFLLRKFLLIDSNDPEKIVSSWQDFNILEAIYIAAEAWKTVKTETLKNAWNNLWPALENETQVVKENVTDALLHTLVQDISGCGDCDLEDVKSWLRKDKEEQGYEILDDDGIVQKVLGVDKQTEEIEDEKKIPSNQEILQNLDNVLLWISDQDDVANAQIESIQSLRDKVLSKLQ